MDAEFYENHNAIVAIRMNVKMELNSDEWERHAEKGKNEFCNLLRQAD